MSSYLTDNATSDPAADALNFGDFRPALKEILTSAETPLTVGIFGAWGSGKTSLMRMLRDEIESEGKPKARTVWFTAWKYDRQDALWRSLILRVLEAMVPREEGDGPREERPVLQNPGEKQQRLITLLEKLEDSVYQDVEWEELGQRNIRWWQFLSNTGLAGIEIAAALGSGGITPVLKEMTGADGLPIEEIKKAAQAISRETKSYQRRQLFYMEQFEATFKEAVGLIKEARLIVFVDDLDRCLPEKAIEVLEAIKLFLEVPGVVFVLGMDREVVQRGIEARYGHFFSRQPGRHSELPIRGDVYLQKIVQIPFHLPSLAIANLDQFMAGLDKGLSVMTRQVFARGLFPNPRQVKRALNIFHLLQEIARQREKRPAQEGGLPPRSIAWPLLAKTVVIQTQYPDLYQLWRQYPLVMKMLEREYGRQVTSDDEMLLGRLRDHDQPPIDEPQKEPAAQPHSPTERSGGLLAPYLDDRQQYALLAQLLAYPPAEEAGSGRQLARFAGLNRDQMAAYVQLAGTVESEEELPLDLPADLLADLLSGDRLRMQDAAGRLESEEPQKDGPKHRTHRVPLVNIVQNPAELLERRVNAGDALGWIGDERQGVSSLEPQLIPIIEDLTFLMGDEKQEVTIPAAFAIAQYPITNAQFRFFIEEGGYSEARWLDKCWTKEGRDYRQKNNWTQPRYWDDAKYSLSNQPVVGVSWYEAVAYAAWLAQKTGQPYRLPTEAEWERAARHTDGRTYPWGEEWRDGIVNSGEAGISRPTAVGLFLDGAAECGALDMSGNVWEWCRTRWRDEKELEYPQPWADDGREKLEGGNIVWRVLRGGSWADSPTSLRCAYRDGYDPFSRYVNFGFRVCASPFSIPAAGL